MQLFNKKTSGGSGGERIQPWHPNFRNTTELPDIKTVRTKFFINAACVIVAVGSILYCLYTEYNIRTVDQELAAVEQQVAHDSKPSRDAIDRYTKFKDGESKVNELAAFLQPNHLVFSDFIIEIGQTLPEHLSISSVQARETDITLRGIVKSAPELASTLTSAYEKQLRDNKKYSHVFASISLTSLSRDAVAGYLNFEIVLKFNK